MKKTKKYVSAGLALVVTAALALTGCTPATPSTPPPAEPATAAPAETPAPASEAPASEAPTETAAEPSAASKVKIVSGTWEDQIVGLYMAEKFMALHPDIEVEIFNNGTWLGNENTAKLAAAGQMPDVINLENPVYPIQNNWVINLKPYLDRETNLTLPESFVKYGTFNDQLIMVPNSVFFFGVIVNKTLLAQNNIPIPEYGWTIDEFVNIAKRTTRKGQSIGTTEIQPIPKHLPPQVNDDLGWGAFNEVTKQYQLTPEWVEATNIAVDLYQSGATLYERLDATGLPWDFEEGSAERAAVDERRANFLMEELGETDSGVAFYKGKIALYQDFTWATGFPTNENYTGWEYDWYPFPVKEAGDVSRPGIVVDSIGITTSCQNPDAAYEWLKFLTFGTDGIEARFEIYGNYTKADAQARFPGLAETAYPEAVTYNFMPATTDQALIDRWVEFTDSAPGIKYMMGNMGTGFVDGFKVTPGFDEAYHKTIWKAVEDQVLTGQRSASDIADEVTQLANGITAQAYAALGQ
jgi:multiple sugar transport system substrate-binding protein